MTAPQIVFHDPHWLFWIAAGEKLESVYSLQANVVINCAKRIRLPKSFGPKHCAKYTWHASGAFLALEVGPISKAPSADAWLTIKRPWIDATLVRTMNPADKNASATVADALQSILFDTDTVPSKRMCESFFDEPANFEPEFPLSV